MQNADGSLCEDKKIKMKAKNPKSNLSSKNAMLYSRNQGFQRYLNGNQVIQGIQEIKYPVNPPFQQNPTQILHSTQTNPQQLNFNNILIPINHLGPSPANTNQQINFPIPADKILIPMNPQINFNNAVGATPLSLQQQFISNNDLSLQQTNFPIPADKVSPSLPKFSPQQGNKKSFNNQQRNTYKRKILKITPSIKVVSDFNEIFQFGKRLIFEFKTGEMFIGELYTICHYFQKLELINCIMLRGQNDDNNTINLMKNLRSVPIPFFIMEIHLIHHKIPGLNFDDFYFELDEEKPKTENLDNTDSKLTVKKDSSNSDVSSTTTKEELTWNDSIRDAELKSIKSTTQLNVNAAEFKPSGAILPLNNVPEEVEKSDSINSLREVDLKPLITKFISQSNIDKIEKALKGIIKISQWTSKEDFGIAIDNINSEIEIAANFEFQRPQHGTPHTLQIYAPKLNKIFIFDKKSTQSRCIRNIFENSKIRKIIHFNDQIRRSLKSELKFNVTNVIDTYVMFTKLYPPTEDEKTKKNPRKNIPLLEMIEIVLNVKNDYIEYASDIHLMNLNIKKKLIIGKMVIFLYEIYERLFHEQYYRILFSSNFSVIETSKEKDETETVDKPKDTKEDKPKDTKEDKPKDTKEDKKKNKNKNPSHFEYSFKGNFDLNNKLLGVTKKEFQVNYKIPKKFLKKP